jgi:adenosyl cobinamide kinase/adenosyl cobinamide phosphate guanylyltransferase
MALNIANVGRKIARIRDSSDKKLAGLTFSVSDDPEKLELIKSFDSFKIPTGRFQYIPDPKRDRDTIYIAGAAGSGKSYWAASYLREYMRVFPENPIYFFTESEFEDPAFAGMPLKRVHVDRSLIDEPIDFHEFENCCVLFDDIDALTGLLKKTVYELRDKLLKNSRKRRVTVISTSHTFTGIENKAVLNESDVIVFFMMNYNKSLRYLLENYLGLDLDGIKYIKTIKSRSLAYVKSFPNTIISERSIFTIDKLQAI